MSVLPIMISITALFDFGIMIMIFMSMVVGAFFVPMIMCMSIILFFHVSRRIILVIMMFVPMVVSALLVAMIMCMRIVGIIILELG